MNFELDLAIRKQAKTPHELYMFNLAAFHLLMTPATIALGIGIVGVLLPFSLSLLMILYTYWRGKASETHAHWFVMLHWKLALRHYRLLLISYAAAAGLLLLGWLISQGSQDHSMQTILLTVFTRIAVMPILIMVLVNFYLESNAINLAMNGEFPDHLLSKYPHPELTTGQHAATDE